jgi:ribosomal protein L16 Arg81 hydroxylase
VALPALHRLWDPLRALCAELDRELGHSCHANAYITPGCASGFTPHYDTHEVLVLQLAGDFRKWERCWTRCAFARASACTTFAGTSRPSSC